MIDGVTVIIPNYNNARFLKQGIESIISQSLQPYEVIVVDDCSTDNSLDILLNLKQKYPRLKIISLEVNGGVSNARNTGIKEAKTKYVTFMDGDDFYYNPRKLEVEMDLIKKYEKSNKSILAYSAIVIANEQGKVKIPAPIRQKDKKKFIEGNALIPLISLIKQGRVPRDYIVNKEMLSNVGAYAYPYNFYEDLDLLIRLSKCMEFYCTFEYGTAYRMNPNGLSKKSYKEHVRALKTITGYYYKELDTNQKIICNYYKLLKRCRPGYWKNVLKNRTSLIYYRIKYNNSNK